MFLKVEPQYQGIMGVLHLFIKYLCFRSNWLSSNPEELCEFVFFEILPGLSDSEDLDCLLRSASAAHLMDIEAPDCRLRSASVAHLVDSIGFVVLSRFLVLVSIVEIEFILFLSGSLDSLYIFLFLLIELFGANNFYSKNKDNHCTKLFSILKNNNSISIYWPDSYYSFL